MSGFHTNIEKDTEDNTNFRKVLYTGKHSQLVVMSLKPQESIGLETHANVDQFLRCEEGEGKAIIDGEEIEFKEGEAVIVPAGSEHDFINTSQTEDLKLYTVYSPSNHPDGTVHATKEEAMIAEEHEH